MLKLEHSECNALLDIIGVSSFKGTDVPDIAKLIEKIQKESVKTAPDKVIKG